MYSFQTWFADGGGEDGEAAGVCVCVPHTLHLTPYTLHLVFADGGGEVMVKLMVKLVVK